MVSEEKEKKKFTEISNLHHFLGLVLSTLKAAPAHRILVSRALDEPGVRARAALLWWVSLLSHLVTLSGPRCLQL